MKTLVFFGSPRRQGNTAALVSALAAGLEGEIIRVDAYAGGISPCIDCRACWQSPGCAVQDGMQAVYHHIETCDNIVLASPVHFSELSGPLLGLLSRLQTYFAARYFRQETPLAGQCRGVLLFAGAQPGTEKRAAQTANTLMKLMRAPVVATAQAMRTDTLPAAGDAEALAAVRAIAEMLNQAARHA